MPDPFRVARSLASRCAVGALLAGSSLVGSESCVAPYSAASYKDYNPDVLYATICHEGKYTLGIPSDEWPEYKEKGAYRGPCRNRGPIDPDQPVVHDETMTAYEGGRRRAKLSYEAWAAQQALLLGDSTTAHRGQVKLDEDARDAPTAPDR